MTLRSEYLICQQRGHSGSPCRFCNVRTTVVENADDLVYVTPYSGPTSFNDFTVSGIFGLLLPKIVVGAGRTFAMVPGSSTKAATVPVQGSGHTNQLSLLAGGGNSVAQTVAGIDLSDFVIRGTNQGHLYNGLRVGYSTEARLADLLISEIPGNASSPPGETFSLNLWHANGSTVDRVTIDGAGIAATLFGLNSVTNCVLTDCVGKGAASGFALACWQTNNVALHRFDARGNRRCLNFEQCGGAIIIDSPDLRAQTNPDPHITVNSNLGSATVTIINPKVDAWPLRVGVSDRPYFGKPQLQKVADVKLLVDGIDVSGDRTKLACGNVWA